MSRTLHIGSIYINGLKQESSKLPPAELEQLQARYHLFGYYERIRLHSRTVRSKFSYHALCDFAEPVALQPNTITSSTIPTNLPYRTRFETQSVLILRASLAPSIPALSHLARYFPKSKPSVEISWLESPSSSLLWTDQVPEDPTNGAGFEMDGDLIVSSMTAFFNAPHLTCLPFPALDTPESFDQFSTLRVDSFEDCPNGSTDACGQLPPWNWTSFNEPVWHYFNSVPTHIDRVPQDQAVQMHAESKYPISMPFERQLDIVQSAPVCPTPPPLSPAPHPRTFVPIPSSSWYQLSLFPIASQFTARMGMDAYAELGVFAARCSRQTIPLSPSNSYRAIKLLFKSKNLANSFVSNLLSCHGHPTLHIENYDLLSDAPGATLVNYEKILWLPYVGEVHECAMENKELVELMHRAPLHPSNVAVLDFRWKFLGQKGPNYPIPCPTDRADRMRLCPPRHTRKRRLDVIDFDMEWLMSSVLTKKHQFSDREWKEFRYLLMMLRGHTYGGLSQRLIRFIVGMWPTTDGTIDAVIRKIARWRNTEVPTMRQVEKRDETFGVLGNGKFRLELELCLDRGRYLLDPESNFDTVNYSNS